MRAGSTSCLLYTSGTFLAFALMTLAILPIALVYSEISPLFHTAGGELIYNTVGFNRHVGLDVYKRQMECSAKTWSINAGSEISPT